MPSEYAGPGRLKVMRPLVMNVKIAPAALKLCRAGNCGREYGGIFTQSGEIQESRGFKPVGQLFAAIRHAGRAAFHFQRLDGFGRAAQGGVLVFIGKR